MIRGTVFLNGWQDKSTILHRAVVADSKLMPTVSFAGGPSSTNRMAAGDGHVVTSRVGDKNALLAVTLDDLLHSGAVPPHAPLVLKLDIQGCEHAALSGGRALLDHVRVVLIELQSHGKQRRACGGSGKAIVDLLRANGFKRAYMDGGAAAHEIPWKRLQQHVEAAQIHWDARFER